MIKFQKLKMEIYKIDYKVIKIWEKKMKITNNRTTAYKIKKLDKNRKKINGTSNWKTFKI